MTDFNIERQIAAAQRELALRERAYPKWVKKGTMRQEQADAEIAAMKAILNTLCAVRDWGLHPDAEHSAV